MAKKFTGTTEHKHVLMLLMEQLGDETLATTLIEGAVGGTLTWSLTKEHGIVQYEVELDIDESDEGEDAK